MIIQQNKTIQYSWFNSFHNLANKLLQSLGVTQAPIQQLV